MPTKIFFLNASNALSGTFPTGEQSTRTATVTATGANTLRTMTNRVGIAQSSLAVTTLANTTQQNAFMGFFCSLPLYNDYTVGGGSWILNVSNAESNLAANFFINSINVYVWRPSTGTVVGTVRDAAALGGAEPAAAGSQRVQTFTFTTSAISALKGDVIICELWAQFTQANATARTGTVYFGGTTENLTLNATVSNHASFLQIAENLQFAQKPMVSVGHPFMF